MIKDPKVENPEANETMTPQCATGGTGDLRRREGTVSIHTPSQSDNVKDPYALYASSIGPRILEHANKIFEEFPVPKYALYFVIFMIEVAAVFYIGIKLSQ